jgi:hypothetical protein
MATRSELTFADLESVMIFSGARWPLSDLGPVSVVVSFSVVWWGSREPLSVISTGRAPWRLHANYRGQTSKAYSMRPRLGRRNGISLVGTHPH